MGDSDENRPLTRSCTKSISRSKKIKHLHAEKVLENSSPVSKLCASMSVTTLETPTTCSKKSEEAKFVATPLKLSQQMHVDSPSLSCAERHMDTTFQTPRKFALSDSEKTTLNTSSKTLLNTPISSQCNPTCSKKSEEAKFVATPLKLSQQMHVDSPSLSCTERHMDTTFQTPRKFVLSDSEKTTLNTSSKTPLNTPISSQCNPTVETPLCFALDKVCELKNVNTTPRRNPRRSCLNTPVVKIHEETPSRRVRRSSILKNKCSESNLFVTKINLCQNNNIPTNELLGSEGNEGNCNQSVTSQVVTNENDIVLEKEMVSNVTSSRKSLFCMAENNNFLGNSVNQNFSFQIKKNLSNKVLSKPRTSKETDSKSSLSRRLSFSAKKCEKKQKDVVPEYDPDNDIFAQGIMPVQFNVDLLKQEIGKFFSASGISSPVLKKSKSCVTLNEIHEDDNVSQIRHTTPVSPKKKPSKQRTLSSPKLKRTVSAPNMIVSSETETKSCEKKKKFESRMRALLRARDIIKNLRQRVKNICNVPNEEKKYLTPQLTTANRVQSCVGNMPSQSSAVSVKCKNVEEVSRKESPNCSFEDPDLSPTQPFESIILRDVTAYVEVISKNEDISAGVRTELKKLGATVVPSFNRNVPVTHVIFNDGHISTYKKAKKRNVPLVSVLWIEECRKAGLKVHESFFPPYQIERYECPSIVKELKKRKIMHFYSDEKPRPLPRRKKGVPKSAVIIPEKETSPQKICEKKCVHEPKWIDEVAGDNGMVRLLVNMTGIGHKEFKELVNRPPTPDSEIELEENSPLPVRLLRKLAKNLPMKEKSGCASRTNLFESTTQISNRSIENSFVKKLDGVEIEMQNSEIDKGEIESVSTQCESADICKVFQSELLNLDQREEIAAKTDNISRYNVIQREEIATKTDNIPRNNVIERTTITRRQSFTNSIVKKKYEMVGTGKDEVHYNKMESPEDNKITNFHHRKVNIKHQDLVPQLENLHLQNVSQRKKVLKRKLLSPVEEAMVGTSDVESFDTENRVIENPHTQPPKQLEGSKKIKSDDGKLLSKTVSNCDENKKEEIVVLENSETNSEVPIRRSRRSSMYFVKVERRCPSPIVQKPGLVCTLLHSVDLELITTIVEKLGTFVVEKNVTSHSTHIITGFPKRTMKVLKGMARGCWIVGHEWVLKSLEANKWLDEEDFELISFSPAVQKYRLEKLSFGRIFKPDIFSNCGRIFVSSRSQAPRGDLVELILLCAGRISSRISNAEIAVGKNCPGLVCVTHLWVLDSVQFYCCKSFDSYLYS